MASNLLLHGKVNIFMRELRAVGLHICVAAASIPPLTSSRRYKAASALRTINASFQSRTRF
ncbi:hypothetical protein BC834DRAFT_911921 [Gloeopeniophorella convolvens]|nr:hypothetical protein BC834DRAFT_911921 [Gloeopeniophorella convolvens]